MESEVFIKWWHCFNSLHLHRLTSLIYSFLLLEFHCTFFQCLILMSSQNVHILLCCFSLIYFNFFYTSAVFLFQLLTILQSMHASPQKKRKAFGYSYSQVTIHMTRLVTTEMFSFIAYDPTNVHSWEVVPKISESG